MEKKTKKLKLSKQTIAVLNDQKMAQVYGGVQLTDNIKCNPVTKLISECLICPI